MISNKNSSKEEKQSKEHLEKEGKSSESNQKMKQYKAVIIGSTGAVGKELLKELNKSALCQSVLSISRRPTIASKGEQLPKVEELIIEDFDKVLLSQSSNAENNALSQRLKKEDTPYNVAFCTLGTTIKKAGSKENFTKIDVTYSKQYADICKKHDVSHFSLLTSAGSSADSYFFYTKSKGELENAIKNMNFPLYSVFRPSLLIAEREESRFGESIAQYIAPCTDMICVGFLKKYRSITVNSVAKAMVYDFERSFEKGEGASFKSYESDQVQELSDKREEEKQ